MNTVQSTVQKSTLFKFYIILETLPTDLNILDMEELILETVPYNFLLYLFSDALLVENVIRGIFAPSTFI